MNLKINLLKLNLAYYCLSVSSFGWLWEIISTVMLAVFSLISGEYFILSPDVPLVIYFYYLSYLFVADHIDIFLQLSFGTCFDN